MRRSVGVAAAAVVGMLIVAAGAATRPAPAAQAGPAGPARGERLSVAQDTATAMRAARAQGGAVEVAGLRSEVRTVYAEPKGGMTAELSLRPVRARRGGAWVAADATLERRPDGSIGPKAATVDLAFSGGGTRAPLVRFGRDGRWLALSWPGDLPAPTLSGDTATYPGVLPGVDLALRAEVDGYAQYLVVRDAEAARNPALARIRLGLRTEGLTVAAVKGGGLEARDADDRVVFTAPASRMWDSAPAVPRQAVVKVAVDAGSLTLLPDPRLLSDPATRFPVTIDPVWHTAGVQAWATVLSGPEVHDHPGWFWSGELPWAQVGYCGWPGCNNIGEAWSYFQFDTSFLQGRTVLSAVLETTMVHSPDCATYSEHELYKAHAGIHPGTTWDNKPGGGLIRRFGLPHANGTYGCPGAKTFTLDVKDTVNLGWTTTWLVKAVVHGDKYTWRKYDPGATKLRVHFNRPPDMPTVLSTDPPLPRPCKHCAGLPWIGDSQIRFKAVLTDPDGDSVRALWHPRVNGVVQPTVDTGYKLSGEVHSLPDNLAPHENRVVDWQVEANDAYHSSPWSAGGGSFGVDLTPPGVAPKVSALLYRDDNRWHGGVGVKDTFTFRSNWVGDVDHFLYGFSDPPTKKVNADRLGGIATATEPPPGDGPQTLFVQSVDRAGHSSPPAKYRFYVRAGSGPLAQWSFEGNTDDDAFLGDRNGGLNGNAKYGPGAVGQALLLDGGEPGTNMGAANTVRTDTSFSVSAWVKPTPAQPARVMGAVSQDGDLNSGFYLSYRGDMGKWAFLMLHSGTEVNPPGTFAVSRAAPQLGRWTHLVGVYDRLENELRLYVNGVLAEEKALPAGFVPWHAAGSIRVGRQQCGGSKCDPWAGSIDEVKLYDRVLGPAEVRAQVGQDDVQAAHWRFDERQGSTARNQVEGGEDAVLHNGASFTGAAGGAVKGALRLDGTDDYASTTGPVVRTDQSFSVAAWVKLERAPQTGWTFTALSQEGSQVSGFFLWYRQLADRGVWEFYTPSADAVSRPVDDEMVVSTVPASLNEWAHLAAVYDAPAKQLRLYVNGQPAGTAPRNAGFDAAGPLQVGRGLWDGNPTNLWPGLVDEVRAYSRELSEAEVRGIVSRDDVALREYKLDGNAGDSSGNGKHGTASAGVEWTGGQTSVPDQTDLAVRLDGAGGHVSAPHAVQTNRSFAVSAWAKLDRDGRLRTVLSQDGGRVSAFKLRATPDNRWSFVMFGQDVDGGGGRAEVVGGAAQVGAWTHLVAMYDAAARRISLFVNGVHAGSADHAHTWDYAPGGLQIGRAKWDGDDRIEFFPGAVDDVAVYGRVLFAEEIRVMAGRDLSLAHNWTLDEPSGPGAADAVGRRTGTLSGGASRTLGRLGNAVALDGVDDVVATSGVDVRTDESFTVSAWVSLADSCDPGASFACKLVAVSVDGASTSKFRLGHLVDQDQNDPGVWMFEMAESDAASAPITKAAVSVLPSDLGTWTHLVGVYDKRARKLWLYVNGTRIGDGTLNNSWQAGGGLLIGRGRNASGAPGQFLPGKVDDVRLYSGGLDDDRIANLYNTYTRKDAPATLPQADAGRWRLDETGGTSAADSSGRALTATLRGGASWQPTGGRAAGGLRLDGTSGYAGTAGPVLDTSRSFSVSAWALLAPPTIPPTSRAQAVVAQEGTRSSAFRLEYRGDLGRWAVVMPPEDKDSPPGTVILASTEPGLPDNWTHLAVAYDANLRQLRLYVNGVLSAAQVGVGTWPSTGPFTIGRARWDGKDVDWFLGVVDDVRAFGRALSDGEVGKLHDDAPPALLGAYSFDDSTARDSTPRQNHATTTGAVTWPAGVSGKALALDGTTASATARFLGPSPRDSFTVSAWANLARKDRTATVLAQDAGRASPFLLQYRPSLDRWVFGAAEQDADAVPVVYAHAGVPAEQGRWTHLTGVYDHGAHELRLYVDGELAGRKTGVTLWDGRGPFTIGRAMRDGQAADLFPGMVDEVRIEIGVVSDDEIARRAAPAAGVDPAGGANPVALPAGTPLSS